jgi:hypothetical protein
VQLSPFSRYFIPLRSKYSPQCPVLKHPLSRRYITLSLFGITVFKSSVRSTPPALRKALGLTRVHWTILLPPRSIYSPVVTIWCSGTQNSILRVFVCLCVCSFGYQNKQQYCGGSHRLTHALLPVFESWFKWCSICVLLQTKQDMYKQERYKTKLSAKVVTW